MLFRQLFDTQTSTFTYLLACDNNKEAILIDSVDQQVDLYMRLIEEFELKLTAAIDTHVHADHVTGMGLLHQRLGCDMVLGRQTDADCATRLVSDGDVINFGCCELKVIHTPGHTQDSYCFLVDDKLFTGDTLFIRGTGRTDFQQGCARSQYKSITNKLFTLADATWVYPGHDYKGMNVSTIAEEKRFNPRLQVENVDAYAAMMNGLNLPRPKLIDVAVPANLVCGLIDKHAG